MKDLQFASSELILNPDGSIYHLSLLPEQLADTVILVGDPDRVTLISKHFDFIYYKVQHREFVTHTGILNGKKLSVVSTGIGTDNIDIVLNELHILANFDLIGRCLKESHKRLNLIRIGTCGALPANIEPDSYVVSTAGIGLDGLMHFYDYNPLPEEQLWSDAVNAALPEIAQKLQAYTFLGSKDLAALFTDGFYHGVTATCAGFYAPQGRRLAYKPTISDLPERLMQVNTSNGIITNFEMETSGIYGLSRILGHEALSISQVLANRTNGKFTERPKEVMQQLIEKVLKIITA